MSVGPHIRTVNGKRFESRSLYVHGRTHTGRRFHIPVGADRRAARTLDAQIAQLVEARRAGVPISPELIAFVQNLEQPLRKRLLALGLIDGSVDLAVSSVQQHIEQWGVYLRDRRRAGRGYIAMKTARVTQALTAGGIVFWSELAQDGAVPRFIDQLHALGETSGWSDQTINHYLSALKGFAAWIHKEYGEKNPFNSNNSAPLPVTEDRLTRVRRPLEEPEIEALISWCTRKGQRRFGCDGIERARLYRLESWTGIRCDAVWGTPRSGYKLDGDSPSITIPAHLQKNKKAHTVPLMDETLIKELTEQCRNKAPAARVWKFWRIRAAAMLEADLEDARAEWILEGKTPRERAERSESEFLRYTTSRGTADFHAFRTVVVRRLVRARVHVAIGQRILGHSRIETTMKHYARFEDADIRDGMTTAAMDLVRRRTSG